MTTNKLYNIVLCAGFALLGAATLRAELVAGPLFSDVSLTLTPGERTEAAGPLYYSQQIETEKQTGFPPFYSWTRDPDLELSEMDIAYPIMSYRRYGGEYRFQLIQLISWAGGRNQEEEAARRFTLFPFYFQYRNTNDPSQNYTALLPFYGHLKNRLFRDDIKFVMFPLYSETRKKTVVTENYLFPIYHQRRGEQLEGWQVWPIVGKEIKGLTYRTNQFDEVETIGGHEKFFAAWPFYFHDHTQLGTDNPEETLAVIPFYTRFRSPLRDSTSYGWPFGYTVTDDREKKYKETGYLWPFFIKARGEGKNTTRIFPFYSHAASTNKESLWYLWPVVKINKLHADPLERTSTRILFFLYSDTAEKNLTSGDSMHHVEFWPFYSSRREFNGNRRLQVLSVLEPIMPNNKSIPRNYAPLYSLWRDEKNAKTGAESQSLLWNLYRREQAPVGKKLSILFGLFQYESHSEGKKWRICYFPIEQKTAGATGK